MSLVSIRGAITVTSNIKEEILDATEKMLTAIIENNQIQCYTKTNMSGHFFVL